MIFKKECYNTCYTLILNDVPEKNDNLNRFKGTIEYVRSDVKQIALISVQESSDGRYEAFIHKESYPIPTTIKKRLRSEAIKMVIEFTAVSNYDFKMRLTEQNYYSNEANYEFMSVSQYKDFIECGSRANAKLQELYKDEMSEALLIGNYVHSYFESTDAHNKFIKENEKALLTKKGELRASFKQANEMIDKLEKDIFFNDLYQGQKEVIITGELFGVDWKGKIDCLNIEKGYFVDLKTTQDVHKTFWNEETRQRQSFIEEYKYDVQMAIYKKLLEQKFNKPFTPIIVAVTKQTPPDLEAIKFLDVRLENKLKEVEKNIKKVVAMKNGEAKPHRCGKCSYCRSSKKLENFVEVEDLISR